MRHVLAPCAMRYAPCTYSYRKDSTGFVMAARIA